jgi:peptidyl-prolyl cis-trans isomerase A (cyclophilin A)
MKLHAVLPVLIAALVLSCQKKEDEPSAAPEINAAEQSDATQAEQPAEANDEADPDAAGPAGSAAPEEASAEAPAAEPDPHPRVRLETSKGDIVIELDREKAPITVDNFLGYVEQEHYDGTIFHRVIDGFMIQGGGFALEDDQPVEKQTGSGIKNEAKNGLKNDRGTVAMARTGDPNSATAQFFINVNDNAGLNHPNPDGHGYAVFGKVVEGMDVVDAIKGVETGTKQITMMHPATGAKIRQPADDVPLEPVVIEHATLVTDTE